MHSVASYELVRFFSAKRSCNTKVLWPDVGPQVLKEFIVSHMENAQPKLLATDSMGLARNAPRSCWRFPESTPTIFLQGLNRLRWCVAFSFDQHADNTGFDSSYYAS